LIVTTRNSLKSHFELEKHSVSADLSQACQPRVS